MNRETIIQMARESGLVDRVHIGSEAGRELSIRKMQAFATLVAAKEREECAKVCAALEHGTLAAQEGAANDLENVMLRQVASLGHAQCAAAIRARGGGCMSEHHNLDATVFVYEHKTTGEIKAFYRESAVSFNNSKAASDWSHVGTLEPRMWIQAHWKDVG